MTSRKDLRKRKLAKIYYHKNKKGKIKIDNNILPVRENITEPINTNKYWITGEIVDTNIGKRRIIGNIFNYKGVKLEVVEQWCKDKCKYCYFNNSNTDLITDCSITRDITITGVCFHNILFKKVK